jgi:hypothetical protein
MALGLYGFTETMRGTWTPLDGSGRKTMWFTAEADAADAVAYFKNGSVELLGRLHCEGLAGEVETRGHMEVQPLARRIGYDLEFRGDDGRRYRFVGQKTLSVLRLARTMTLLPGEVLDAEGARVGTARLYFDLRRDLLPFLATFRRARTIHQLKPAEVEG